MLRLNRGYLFIILSLLFCACEKELSLEGTGGTSVFTFAGSPGACTNPVISGTYQVGTALDSSNTVTLDVDVTSTGTYNISTGALNGISFTGTGVFTTTGPQAIALIGSGTPAAAGPFSFTPGFNGCTFIITTSTGGGSSGGTAAYTLNGAPGNCTSFAPGGTYTAGTPLAASNFATISVTVTTPGTYTISTNTVNGMTFSGTGTFATTGIKTVNLAGAGTPLAGGTFTFTPGTNGCTFPITVSGTGAGNAVFTYNGAPNACTTATPGGTFAVGTPLTASNTVLLGVNVTTVGNYTISTPVVNGFSFSGTGTFSSTGPQSVTLTGTGTPILDGVHNFVPSNGGCSFPITVVAGPIAGDFLECTMDGVATTFNINLVVDTTDPADIIMGGQQTASQTSPFFIIRLVKTPAVTTGTYNKGSATNQSTYCLAGYNDGVDTTLWAVDVLGTGTFVVNVTSFTATKITGTFSGTLFYDNGFGTLPKVITLGKFSASF